MAIQPATSPTDLQFFLDTQANEIRSMLKRTIEDIASIGERLLQVKSKFKRDADFENWVQESLGISDKSADNFMNTALFMKTHQNFSHLDPSAIYELAAPNTPEALIKAAEDGKIDTDVASLKAAKKEYKAASAEGNGTYGSSSSGRLTTKQLVQEVIKLIEQSEIYGVKPSQELSQQLEKKIEPLIAAIKNRPWDWNKRKKVIDALTVLGELIQDWEV